MATEAVRMDAYYRVAPALRYVTSADDVAGYSAGRPAVGTGRSCVAERRGRALNSVSGTVWGDAWSCRRKLSVDDGPRRRGVAASEETPAGTVHAEDCSFQQRRRSSAWSPGVPVSTLSRTLSEHTLDRSVQYRAAAECRNDVLDDCNESFLSPPRIAPVSGQLSLVCIYIMLHRLSLTY